MASRRRRRRHFALACDRGRLGWRLCSKGNARDRRSAEDSLWAARAWAPSSSRSSASSKSSFWLVRAPWIERGLFGRRGEFRAVAGGAGRGGARLCPASAPPACRLVSSSKGSPGGVGAGLTAARFGQWSPACPVSSNGERAPPEAAAASAWSRRVALPSPPRPRPRAAAPCVSPPSQRNFLERFLLVGRRRARAAPAVRELAPARRVIAEILMLVSLVNRVFLVAGHPLSLDRVPVGKARSAAPALAPASSRPRSKLPEPVLGLDSSSLFAFLASSGRGGSVRLRIHWAETIPFLPPILIGSIGSLPSLLQRNWEERSNFGFYVNNECGAFVERLGFECSHDEPGVERMKQG